MSEYSLTCQIQKKYGGIECANPALGGDRDGRCILHSQNPDKDLEAFVEAVLARGALEGAKFIDFRHVFFPGPFESIFFSILEFDKAVDFSGATFTSFVDFSTATFTKAADFSWATFTRGVDFSRTIFMEGADFSEATFKEDADFSGAFMKANFSLAKFKGEANFSWATFSKEGNFFGAIFSKGANFIEASFTKLAVFIDAIFTEDANFIKATFAAEASFSGSRIAGRVVFQSLNTPGDEEKEPLPAVFQANFRDLELSPEAVLQFRDLSLTNALFEGTDLRRVEFHHVQWHPYRGRQAIYDEVLLRQEEKQNPWFWNWLLYAEPHTNPPFYWTDKYGEVERLYRELQENYEKARDYKKMGDFHYGEMEMHRRANKWRWFPFYWYNLYWALNGYGERPRRALVWLAAFLAVFTGLLAWAGLDPVPPHVSAFGDSFFYLLQKVTLQRPTWAEPMGFGGKLAAGLSVLLIPGQAALFLLALRNRLGRRR